MTVTNAPQIAESSAKIFNISSILTETNRIANTAFPKKPQSTNLSELCKNDIIYTLNIYVYNSLIKNSNNSTIIKINSISEQNTRVIG